MDVVAEFVNIVYLKAKESEIYQRDYKDKDIVIIFDKAPAHSHLERNMAFWSESVEELEDRANQL